MIHGIDCKIIDAHGHNTRAGIKKLEAFRALQLSEKNVLAPSLVPDISDDELREALAGEQQRIQAERGIDLTVFSPRASTMDHHRGDPDINVQWSRVSNDLVARAAELFPGKFAGVCQLPQYPEADLRTSVIELERCVLDHGFVGCNLNPDPSGGKWSSPPLGDKRWYPLYEKMVELDVPAMIHVSGVCDDHKHANHFTGTHYLNADTTAFEQLLRGGKTLFQDFPDLKMILPHGAGGAIMHYGRFDGLARRNKWMLPDELLQHKVFIDTCVYDPHGMEALLKRVPANRVLFAQEILGAVDGDNPETGMPYDRTMQYIGEAELKGGARISEGQMREIVNANARAVYGKGLIKQLAMA